MFTREARRTPQGYGPETSFFRSEIEICARPILQFFLLEKIRSTPFKSLTESA